MVERTDEELLDEIDEFLRTDGTNWKNVGKGLFALAAIIILLGGIIFVLAFIDKKVDKPEYKEQVEFGQLLESVKDTPFTITIDGKKYTVTVGENHE